jgi:uncharacterized membrane protein
MGAIVQARGAQFASACEAGFATCAVLAFAAALLALRWLHPERSRRVLGTDVAQPQAAVIQAQ